MNNYLMFDKLLKCIYTQVFTRSNGLVFQDTVGSCPVGHVVEQEKVRKRMLTTEEGGVASVEKTRREAQRIHNRVSV